METPQTAARHLDACAALCDGCAKAWHSETSNFSISDHLQNARAQASPSGVEDVRFLEVFREADEAAVGLKADEEASAAVGLIVYHFAKASGPAAAPPAVLKAKAPAASHAPPAVLKAAAPAVFATPPAVLKAAAPVASHAAPAVLKTAALTAFAAPPAGLKASTSAAAAAPAVLKAPAVGAATAVVVETGAANEDELNGQKESWRGSCALCLGILPLAHEEQIFFECCARKICVKCFRAREEYDDRCFICLRNRGSANDRLQILEAHAFRGNAEAQLHLGDAVMYGVSQCAHEAFFFYKKAAQQGHARALVRLASCYANGYGAEIDDESAFLCFEKAARQGHPLAQCNLGTLYQAGRGVPQSQSKALKWFRRAAQQGLPQAKDALEEREQGDARLLQRALFRLTPRIEDDAALSQRRGSANDAARGMPP
mmetsp:Transcript_9496/g.33309  ORF Transcript_9496/g.33309 Transcript_9496/m.33309 type:complete len:430 (+) Transcript_9496:230-1519(+)